MLIISGKKLYIPHTLILKLKSPGFLGLTLLGQRAVNNRETAHKRYFSHLSSETHALYIYVRNHAKSILQITKKSFTNNKSKNLSNSKFFFVISGI